MQNVAQSERSPDRRTFLTSAGLAAISMLVSSATHAAAPAMSAEEQANLKLVNDFCSTFSTRDMRRILPFLADDCVYRMTETTPPANGHAGVTERLQAFVQRSESITFEVLDSYAKGPMVINHRIDRFVSTVQPLTWEGVGVFFVKDGRIREWFDYTMRVTR